VNVRRTVRRFSRLILAVTGGLVLIVALATPASARTPVDPSTLNPPPPDFFNAECYLDGSHISCDLAFSDPAVVDEPTGIVCDGTELLSSFSRSVVGKRTYDADGNLLQRHFREDVDGTFRNPTQDGSRSGRRTPPTSTTWPFQATRPPAPNRRLGCGGSGCRMEAPS
jgi:hypothetical protein